MGKRSLFDTLITDYWFTVTVVEDNNTNTKGLTSVPSIGDVVRGNNKTIINPITHWTMERVWKYWRKYSKMSE